MRCRLPELVSRKTEAVQVSSRNISSEGSSCFASPDGGPSVCLPSCKSGRDCPLGYRCGEDNVCVQESKYMIDGEDGIYTTDESLLEEGTDQEVILVPKGQQQSSCSAVSILDDRGVGALGWLALFGAVLGLVYVRRRV